MNAVDSSVVIAGFASWHEQHGRARAALETGPHLIAHCALESYAVLTRLPAPHRASSAIVTEYLRAQFPSDPLSLAIPAITLVEELCALGISGGTVYDGLIAVTARSHHATLFTLDRRAEAIYTRCGTNFVNISEIRR